MNGADVNDDDTFKQSQCVHFLLKFGQVFRMFLSANVFIHFDLIIPCLHRLMPIKHFCPFLLFCRLRHQAAIKCFPTTPTS